MREPRTAESWVASLLRLMGLWNWLTVTEAAKILQPMRTHHQRWISAWIGKRQLTTWATSFSSNYRVLAWIGNSHFNESFNSSTIAQDYDKFWVGETSNIVKVVERDAAIPSGISTTRRPIETTTPSFSRSTSRQQQNDDKIYEGCGDIKTCFGSPDNCVASKSCQTFSAVIVRGRVEKKHLNRVSCSLNVFLPKATATSSSWNRKRTLLMSLLAYQTTIRWEATRLWNASRNQALSRHTLRWLSLAMANTILPEQESWVNSSRTQSPFLRK